MLRFTRLALCLLLLPLLLLSASCSAADLSDESNTPQDIPSPSAEPDSLLLSDDRGCRIVYADEAKSAALTLYRSFVLLDPRTLEYEGYYEITEDELPEDGKTEILVGLTDRAQSSVGYGTISSYLDYSLSVIDGKIVICAYSPSSLDLAVEACISRLSYTEDGKLVYHAPNEPVLYRHTDYAYTDFFVGEKSLFDFVCVLPAKASNAERQYAVQFKNWLGRMTGKILTVTDDTLDEHKNEILIGATNRPESAPLIAALEPGEYKIQTENKNGGTKILMAYSIPPALETMLADVEAHVEGKSAFPETLSGKFKDGAFIVSSISGLRDPFVLPEDGVYYVYGTGWSCYKNTSGKLDGEWEKLDRVVHTPPNASGDYWAPEVYKYNGEFYMFTTYRSSLTENRGCAVFKSASPEGPFVQISDGHVTPADWDAIDGTLYVDEDGQPWMIFVHEWTSTDDNIGRMAAAKLSDDLTHFISAPIELFRADDPAWANDHVTDGCFMYRCQSGELLMLWSTFNRGGYIVAVARSDNGQIDGSWSHDQEFLYSRAKGDNHDGGHGMIFTSLCGQTYLAIHSPNSASPKREETPLFIAIREENGTLVWDKN